MIHADTAIHGLQPFYFRCLPDGDHSVYGSTTASYLAFFADNDAAVHGGNAIGLFLAILYVNGFIDAENISQKDREERVYHLGTDIHEETDQPREKDIPAETEKRTKKQFMNST